MRVGDFSVEVLADGDAREIESGHVLSRPGQVYVLRLRNHGPLRCVAEVTIDGHAVTAGGLVINAWSSVDLERPIHASERGRFTVIAEGDERVFGPDGGRDNPDLGLIEARFRRELPNTARPEPTIARPIVALPSPPSNPASPEPFPSPRRPLAPPGWTPPTWESSAPRAPSRGRFGSIRAFLGSHSSVDGVVTPEQPTTDAIERAAGTGLTGRSDQEFVSVSVGTLETEATVIQLRLVIATEQELGAARALPASNAAPARPAARP